MAAAGRPDDEADAKVYHAVTQIRDSSGDAGEMTRRDVPRAIRSPAPTASSMRDDGYCPRRLRPAGYSTTRVNLGARGRGQQSSTLT